MTRLPGWLALLALAVLGGQVLYLVAGPVLDNDVWWHLAHGRVYAAHGPWLDVDPCLGTAERGPIPHSWLFDAAASVLADAAGIQGLRVAHGIACVAIFALAFALLRRDAGSLAAAALGTGLFMVLAWYRLVQVRPEVLSIGFSLLLHRWLFAPALPSWRNVALVVGLVALWANLHALFAVGPLLMLAALGGVVVRVGAARAFGFDPGTDPARGVRLGSALLLSLLASLLNPRGIAQHLAYLESSGAGAIRFVADEWLPFVPWTPGVASPAVSLLAWGVTDLLGVAFLAAAAVGLVRFLRAPSRERLDAADPVRLALGGAGLVALLVAIRFLWLGVFPLLFLVHALRHGGAAESRGIAAVVAGATAALALAFPRLGGFDAVAAHYPPSFSGWLAQAHTADRFFDVGVRFLAESGARGQLFNDYALGGYLCYRAGPGVRTFVDGSMNFPDAVAVDYRNALSGHGTRPGESFSALLDRRGVDLFFGFGVPVGDGGAYSTTALAGHPDWRLVSRSWRHGIYLRDDPRNADALDRVAAWYAAQGIPFDPAVGFEPGRVLREHREFADAWELWPEGWSDRIDPAPGQGLRQRVRRREALGLGYALVGAFEDQVRNDRRAAALRPRAKAPRRRLVHGLLRLGLDERALARAAELVAIDPDDPRSAAFARAAREVAGVTDVDTRNRILDGLPLLASRQPLRQ